MKFHIHYPGKQKIFELQNYISNASLSTNTDELKIVVYTKTNIIIYMVQLYKLDYTFTTQKWNFISHQHSRNYKHKIKASIRSLLIVNEQKLFQSKLPMNEQSLKC